MRRAVIAVVVAVSFAALLATGTRALAEPPEKVAAGPAARPAPKPPVKADVEEVREWLRRLTPAERRTLLRELLSVLRRDVAERYRRAAQERFRRADANHDGVLSFEEAWEAGLFRGQPRRGRERPLGPPGVPGLRQRPERRPGQRRPPGPQLRPRGPEASKPLGEPPATEFEQELLDTWDLLQELNILERGAGEE